MLSRVFIDRPIFAWVIAIVVMLIGVGAILSLPIAQYPDIAPPTINIRATYAGASADTMESSVTQVIEQQLTGLDGMLYFSSSSNSAGSVTISVTFTKGTNPDIAQVQVQNKVQQALPRLPQQVQQQGLTVTKSNTDFLILVALYDETGRASASDISDYLASNMQEPLGRIPGVGDSNVFGAQYAMRIWLDPFRMSSLGVMPSDIINAVGAQNTQVAAGQIGAQPSLPDQQLNATVTAKSRLQTPDQFRAIVIKTQPNGSQVRLADVARVELGSDNYLSMTRFNGHPASGIALQLAPGGDALATADAVKAAVAQMAKSFPSGYKAAFPRDSTPFIKLSIKEVVKTLFEAVLLVVIVMFVFLQDWRATLIPTIAVPVVLLGTFGVLAAFGYSINTLTLFGLVLSIGLLVDDAIVVVENVERVMAEEGLAPREATIKSMDEITSALVGIALVLSAVFLPMAFFGGSTGVIYRQFSITIVSSMALSVMVALILTPALTATLLKPHHERTPVEGRFAPLQRFFIWFDDRFSRLRRSYIGGVRASITHPKRFLLGYLLIVAGLVVAFLRLPTGFLPTEDQGVALVQYTLPPGATFSRTLAAAEKIENYFLTHEQKNVPALFTASGFQFGGVSQSVGTGFVELAPWDDRKGSENSVLAINARANAALAGLRDAQFFALVPPPVQGLGQSTGFTMELVNTGSLSRAEFNARRNRLLALASADPMLAAVRLSALSDTPQLNVDIDEAKLSTLGLSPDDVNTTISAAWGGIYVNDFVDRGRVKRVYVQGDAPYRSVPDDLGNWKVRSSSGTMTPFSAFASTHWSMAPQTLTRFNGLMSSEFQGQAAPGHSSGAAMERMIQLTNQLGPGVGVLWSGLSYQERLSSGQAPMLYALSLLVIFLCLAALYESWSVPFSVLLVVPLGVIGAVLAVVLRGLENDIYFQVGLLTTMGLSAKNAILIVEFAEAAEQSGKPPLDAALEAARLRLRPILMTSFAFIFGVLPLAIATGAGAQSRIAIGTAVVGGMLTATVLAIFYIPLFFVLVRRLFRTRAEREAERTPPGGAPEAA